MKRVRFAPSPTGSLHVGNALSAVANRTLGDWMLLRIDDTDPQRNVPGGEEEIIRDLEWLGLTWDDGPVRQSERQDRYREAGEKLGERFDGITLLREDGTATYHLATVVDDADFGITHIARRDRRVAARSGNPRRGRPPLPRAARRPATRRALRPAAHPPARDRGDRSDERRGARRARGRCRRNRPRAARCAR